MIIYEKNEKKGVRVFRFKSVLKMVDKFEVVG